jgi:predicted O-linked N-acetylglucosamine transferase (SPINDLY family)
MPFGGVNGTIEALDMNVPVVTLVGKRHGERTSYSILETLGVRATIAETGREYVDIAERLAGDAGFLAEVRRGIAAGIANSTFTDMAAHTRNLEAAYRTAIEAWTDG